ncbi:MULTISPECIES: oleate hydratase [unclassified Bradyrhizobium]|uniref:oleate hydratase n=1 Tax=Bradyrhizobium sp. USDA 4541 TaxID=2817704 RepID=UPI0020A2FC20|nr:oleate hydratase [Bradyrhizobium sp. USDA 4541]MCP1850135.1 oleate hydratase [Bradyrhizobium sp. USDA 4541]
MCSSFPVSRRDPVTEAAPRRAYLVGTGIASLATAVYLLKDGGLLGQHIVLFEQLEQFGGSLDAHGNPKDGYVMRGGRMFEEKFNCTYDLLSLIPSIADPSRSVMEELKEFHQEFFWNDKARLVSGGQIVDVSDLGFSERDRLDLISLCGAPESLLNSRTIQDWFGYHFFQSNFWFIWSTTFAFKPWHSATEFKRYCLRFLHLFSTIDTMAGIYRTPFNQFDAIVRPIVAWLKAGGVQFEMAAEVIDIEVVIEGPQKIATRLHYRQGGKDRAIDLAERDLVFVTNGSMTSDTSYGSMDTVPVLKTERSGGSWKLWELLAGKSRDFGNPTVFVSKIDRSKWESFTVTADDACFFDWLEAFSGSKAGKGGLVTIKDSNWLLTIVLNRQPHYYEQPKNVWVWWGYGLFPDNPGNFVHKPMSECTGREILVELLSHLRFNEIIPHVLKTSRVVMAMMPYITAQFMPRAKTDRPKVIPKGSSNLAFIGQFCEIPDDVVFTVEYSVRAAQTAVFGLLDIQRPVSPFYKGQHDSRVLFDAWKTLHRH